MITPKLSEEAIKDLKVFGLGFGSKNYFKPSSMIFMSGGREGVIKRLLNLG
jgi:hypothetical protein